jgi:Na+/H+-dicarboxylate symporter
MSAGPGEMRNSESSEDKKSHLTLYICGAIVAAVVVALVMPNLAMKFHVGGEIFLRLLKMMVVPLVMASVMSGILGLGDVRKLGRPGGYAVLYYLSTTLLAVIVGLIAVNLIRPGAGMAVEEVAAKTAAPAKVRRALAEATGLEEKELADIFEELKSPGEEAGIGTILNNLVLQLFTDNLIASGARTDLLPLIVFSIIFAGMLTTMGSRVAALTEMISQVNDALLSFILLLMKIAPLGIFCLVTARFGEAHAGGEFLNELKKTAWYVVTVLSGLGAHALITLPLICWIFTRRNPYRFMYQMSQALLTAFSTASSSASLPVTMECAVEKAGVSKRSTEFVLPLGATINMDGTALYEAAAALFIAQAFGVELSILGQLTVALTATLAAIGAAGIPEAGLVTMIIVLNAAGLPLEGVALILSVDWFLDRFRTAVNAFGDAVGSAVVENSFA